MSIYQNIGVISGPNRLKFWYNNFSLIFSNSFDLFDEYYYHIIIPKARKAYKTTN